MKIFRLNLWFQIQWDEGIDVCVNLEWLQTSYNSTWKKIESIEVKNKSKGKTKCSKLKALIATWQGYLALET